MVHYSSEIGMRTNRITIKQQHVDLTGRQLAGILLAFWPMPKAPLRQAFLAQSKSLAVINQNLHRRGFTVAEQKNDS